MRKPLLFVVVFCLATTLACGGKLPPTITPSPGSSLTGHWVGLAPEGLLSVPAGSCDQEITLDLTQDGSVLRGTATTRTSNGLDCLVLSNVELSTGLLSPVELIGTVSAGTVSFRIIPSRFNNGVPNQVRGIIAAGTFTDTHLIMSGSVIAPRAWNDANRDFVPDCDLLNPVANGECGAVSKPTLQTTLTATR